MQEGRGRPEEDGLVRRAGVDLLGDVLELGDAADAMRRVGVEVAGAIGRADLEVLLVAEAGELLVAVVLGCPYGNSV